MVSGTGSGAAACTGHRRRNTSPQNLDRILPHARALANCRRRHGKRAAGAAVVVTIATTLRQFIAVAPINHITKHIAFRQNCARIERPVIDNTRAFLSIRSMKRAFDRQ
jgi:hypothetical protein